MLELFCCITKTVSTTVKYSLLLPFCFNSQNVEISLIKAYIMIRCPRIVVKANALIALSRT